ncbi:MAG: TRAP transporter substrate-binding protein [Pseudomonadota bacterium]
MMKQWVMAAAVLLAAGTHANAQEHTLKLGHAAASSHAFHTGLELFAERVAEKTDGAVVIEVFGDRALGDDRQLLEGLQLGTIDGALVSAPVLPLVIGASSFDALQLPFVVGSYEKLAAALTSPVGEELLQTLDEKGMKGLGFIEAGQRHFLSANAPVRSVEDFKGLKTRIVPIPLHKGVWEAVGVNPIGMAYGEVYSALETGTIDAVEINLSSIQSESLFESAKYVTKTGHYFWPGVIMIAGPVWERLSDAHKTALMEAGRETTEETYAAAAALEADVEAALTEMGVSVNELSSLAAMQEATRPVVDEWLTKDPLIRSFYDTVTAGN